MFQVTRCPDTGAVEGSMLQLDELFHSEHRPASHHELELEGHWRYKPEENQENQIENNFFFISLLTLESNFLTYSNGHCLTLLNMLEFIL